MSMMDNKWYKRVAAVSATTLILGLFGAVACDDDSSEEYTVNTQDKWVGSPCTCDESVDVRDCSALTVPIPNGKRLVGCDNLPETSGASKVCLRTIAKEFEIMAPTTYFPAGYCSLAAVECTNSNLCVMGAAFGDYEAMTSCPAGSAMVIGSFDYYLMDPDHKEAPAHFRQKTCTKLCNTDADCNADGEMSCIERKGAKFCYNEKNFEVTGEPTEVKVFE